MMWNKFLNLFTVLTLLSLLISPVGSARAQESGPGRKKTPLHFTGYRPAPPKESIAPSASSSTPAITNLISGNLLQDPSFEASYGSSAFWGQSSTNFNTPLCDVNACGTGVAAAPRTGNVWAWFGGADFVNNPNLISPEEGQVWQNVTFPSCGALLQFYFWIGAAAPGSDANDIFIVGIDGIGVFSANATQASSYSSYKLVSVDVSSFADGAVHLVQFYSNISGQFVNMNLDDVSLIGGCPTISGNAGVAGASLTYTGGSTSADGGGNYSFDVPFGWSGTVTPSLPCFTFSPLSHSYSNLTSDQTAQNYSASFNPASGCANINVKIGATSAGTYRIPPHGSLRVSYAGTNNGPVNVISTNGVPIIAAERVISYSDNTKTKITHFSELMGLPQSLVSTQYAFPAYDRVNFDSQLRFGNVSASTAHVHVFMGSQEISGNLCTPTPSTAYPYTLAPSASLRVSCAGVNAGPVRIVSDQNIVASLRVIYTKGSAVTSFSEMMGLPASQWNTIYWMPWYNNVNLNSQLRLGNVSASTAHVHVFIHGAEMAGSPFTIPAKASVRPSFAGINDGPIKIASDVPIVASLRVAHFNGTDPHGTDFSELMGLPDSQKSTSYLFPWYNNLNLDSQLRFGNISASTAHVHVFIGAAEMAGSPFTLAPGASTRQSFAGVSDGPVKIVSDQTIVASLRVVINNGSAGLAFSELMGLPAVQLTTSYVLPWYNNVNLDTQLRFGVP